MKTLYQPVRLWVVGGRLHVGDGQDGAEGGPQAGGELCPSVASNDRGNTEPLNPAREEGSRAVGGGDTAERDSFRPAGGPVNYREEVGEPRRLWKGSHQVNMNVLETVVGNGDGCWRKMYVA